MILKVAAAATPRVPSLLRWGVSSDADLVYRTLVACGALAEAGIARELGVSPNRVGQALEELVALSAVTLLAVPGRARDGLRHWSATSVERVLGTVRSRRMRGQRRRPGRWHDQLAAAGIDPFALDVDAVRALPSRLAARHRIAELVRGERHEHLTINTEQAISSDAAQVGSPLDRELLARGLRVRTLGLPASQSCAYAVDWAGIGVDYREADALPMKLFIFDRTRALLAADPDDFDAGAIEISDPLTVDQLTTLFHRLWAEGRDPRRNGVPPIVLTQREKAIVALLAIGHTEESAASELELSRRTIVYTLRSMMDRLSVENRFQLALVLGATGAVPLPAPYREVEPAPCSDT